MVRMFAQKVHHRHPQCLFTIVTSLVLEAALISLDPLDLGLHGVYALHVPLNFYFGLLDGIYLGSQLF